MAERIISPMESITIRARQPDKLKKGPVAIEIALTIDKKYVQLLFPDRLEPMEGMMFTGKEAMRIGDLFHEKARLVIE
ncbi:MAG: hypothetical protein E3J94_07210 [Desulfobacteraceae bacterium]|nr:MAG: hypothetical protein E3J94_07210 [Desulfobacteraceae bacterium]